MWGRIYAKRRTLHDLPTSLSVGVPLPETTLSRPARTGAHPAQKPGAFAGVPALKLPVATSFKHVSPAGAAVAVPMSTQCLPDFKAASMAGNLTIRIRHRIGECILGKCLVW
jgi:hypothetical protein